MGRALHPPFEDWTKHVKGLTRKEQRKSGGYVALSTGVPLTYSEVEIIEDDSPGLSGCEAATNEGTGPAEQIASFVRPPEFVTVDGTVAVVGTCQPVSGNWPVLHEDALHGLAGQIVRTVSPETEADPAGVLLGLLVCYGNAVGRSAWFGVGPERHHANLFACLVGDTASAKGQSWGIARALMSSAAPVWAERCIGYGLSSGEGLVERVRDVDENSPNKDGGGAAGVVELGAVDKRLLCYEAEFARLLSVKGREGNTLGANLRAAWDGVPLEVMNRRQNALRSTGHHISILGNVTPDELADSLRRGTDTVNGFVNRFVWAMVRRSKLLPMGGNAGVLDGFAGPLAEALAFAETAGRCERTVAAERLWVCVYPELAEGRTGLWGKATERARPQVMRLALIYALLDHRSEIDTQHLRAALAVWQYCQESARLLFGANNLLNPIPNGQDGGALAERVLKITESMPDGCSRTDLHDALHRNVRAADLDRALAWLAENGLVRSESAATGGRPAEVWFPVPPAERSGVKNCAADPAVTEPVATNEEATTGRLSPEEPTSFARSNPPDPLDDDDFLSDANIERMRAEKGLSLDL